MQAVSVIYTAPEGMDARFYGWWGEMEFGPSLVQVLAVPRQGILKISYLEPIAAEKIDRKTLAKTLETSVRGAFS